jgi:CDP-6-deoxy-D-xylo-4-hexulose-3-dehydrase
MNFKFPLATSSWGAEEIESMHSVIASGQYTMGNNVVMFENAFATFLGSRHCVMVNSGSSANLLMVAALFYTKDDTLRLKRGDEVVVPAVSWSTTYFPLYQYGLKIKFVDVDLETLNFDLEHLSNAVTDKTRLVFAVNLLGNPNEFRRIKDIIGERNIVLLEDNCESLGATYEGKQAGTFGVMGSHSSFFSHHISTMEGGLVATDNEELYQILLSLRAHGWTRNLPNKNLICTDKSDDSFSESYRFVLPGYNVRPLELEGAVGIQQMKRLPLIIEERRRNGKLLQQALKDHPDILIQKEIGQSSWFGFSLLVRPGSKLTRYDLKERLNELGFEYRPIVAGNFAKNEVIKYFDYEIHKSLTNADYIDRNGLFVGNHSYPMGVAIDFLRNL